MIICYRLEHKNGDGLFFTKNGINKTNPDIIFNNIGLYAFLDKRRFLEPSYIDFLYNNDYLLYKITLNKIIHQNNNGQIIFNPDHILNKEKIDKLKNF